jgi:hypothetical protein
MLITAGLYDARISFAEPAKYVAKLRKMRTDAGLTLFKIYLTAGHMGASARYDAFEEVAFRWAFLIDRLCPSALLAHSESLLKVITLPTTQTPPDLLSMFMVKCIYIYI